ncbi:helix-turn-helix domain-containing protein [Phytoactinopolyspora limicola]|uniref:helix-turn-helix domain-containing protein n=1 Tax=Phytoactinopolyspora limicola TaxID=2715536 RepID=UPI0014076477|nr:AraC family transcriptional regulator [Phytoactinopolyspora limicola]
MYCRTDPPAAGVHAWRPTIDGITEVFHAGFVDHAYPAHTHLTWTLLIVDDGAISYALDRHPHGALRPTVTLLPPHVVHDGRTVTPRGFRKRVLYLDSSVLDDDLIGPAVDDPSITDALLRRRIHQLHQALAHPGEVLEADSRLALVADRLERHLRRQRPAAEPPRPGLAEDLRELLDTHIGSGLSLRQAAERLHAHPTHLVRTFSARFGLPPHVYLIGRRVELARGLLLTGIRPTDVAIRAGFYDQAHLTRHFKRYVGTTPAHYAASRRV